jgi:hypothetical protein
MKRILDPSFRYQPSFATDLRKTFARARRGLQTALRKKAGKEASEQILRIAQAKLPGR